MNVFLVEDSLPIRSLLARRLQHIPGMCVVGEADEEDQALALIRWSRPDLVMMDLSLSKGSGLNLLPELRRGGYKGRIAVLTSQMANPYRRICLEAGADAFYDKGVSLEELFADLSEGASAAKAADSEASREDLTLDALSGLYDEAELHERLELAMQGVRRQGAHVAVYVLRVEDGASLSAWQSERLAARLSQACAPGDFVVRRNAEQFCVVMTRIACAAQAAAATQRLSALLATPLAPDGVPLRTALGMALFPTDAVCAQALLTRAEAKAFGAL